jgi:hypothetical protein
MLCRRRRARKGLNIRPLEQRAINIVSGLAWIILLPALRSFDRTESSASTNHTPLIPRLDPCWWHGVAPFCYAGETLYQCAQPRFVLVRLTQSSRL